MPLTVLVASLALARLASDRLSAQTPAASPSPKPAGLSKAQTTNSLLSLGTKSPVETFRELLAMSFPERSAALAERPPEVRKRMLEKVLEYRALKPDQRELRLRVTELRWYLWPLLKTAETNRAAWLARIPADDRKLVEDRLQHWDKLSAAVRDELLENEATLRYLSEQAASTEEQRAELAKSISPERRKKLEAGIQQIQQMPELQRQKMIARFDQFFELSPAEKEKALGTLSEAERRQLEKTLRVFNGLPPATRDACLNSFEKFVNMSVAERQQFLKNARRWSLMKPAEREEWRELVAALSIYPPMPPDWRAPAAP
jgi:hypothetical protein